jgi:hypothetical protein
MQRVGRHDHSVQIHDGQGVEQRCERGDLVGLALDVDLSEHDTSVLVDHRQQMPAWLDGALTVGVAGSAQGLTVHREYPTSPGRGHRGAQLLDEPADHDVERVGVHGSHDATDRGLARAPATGSERVGQRSGQVSDPLCDRDERPRPRGDRAHRHRQQHH